MGIKSWKAEFYSPISKVKTEKEAIEHSLRKWQGLTDKNLAKHGLERNRNAYPLDIFDIKTQEAVFEVDEGTCSLCRVARKGRFAGCENCPYAKHFSGQHCFDNKRGFAVYTDTGNPTRMIRELKELAEHYVPQ